MFHVDPRYFIMVVLPGLIIGGLASFLVRTRFARYSRVRSRHGFSGAEAARVLLEQAGIHDVKIRPVNGYLTDHYNPVSKELALSEDVYAGHSLAAIGVATHEAGHAIQHARNYAPLWIRSALVPLAGIGSNLGWIVMAVGLAISPFVVLIGAALFSAVLLFQLVTLPVEFDASARAKRLVVEAGIVDMDERYAIDKVLNAAALTYVAAVVTTVLTIVYYLMRAGLLGNRDE
ncbi:MAG: zinc metallopeptidase [Planctomycetes bacterium]|nr:zinc metallopeptidase [Planctomycetota bacterium]